jgi:hypothetical protein
LAEEGDVEEVGWVRASDRPVEEDSLEFKEMRRVVARHILEDREIAQRNIREREQRWKQQRKKEKELVSRIDHRALPTEEAGSTQSDQATQLTQPTPASQSVQSVQSTQPTQSIQPTQSASLSPPTQVTQCSVTLQLPHRAAQYARLPQGEEPTQPPLPTQSTVAVGVVSGVSAVKAQHEDEAVDSGLGAAVDVDSDLGQSVSLSLTRQTVQLRVEDSVARTRARRVASHLFRAGVATDQEAALVEEEKQMDAEDERRASARRRYSVQEILEVRITGGRQIEYLVKWSGYPDSYNSWELYSALGGSRYLHEWWILKFEILQTALDDMSTNKKQLMELLVQQQEMIDKLEADQQQARAQSQPFRLSM